MNTGDTITYTIFGVTMSILFLISAFALYAKNKFYGNQSIVIAIIAFTLLTIAFGSGIIYITKWQIDAKDAATQKTGIRNFIWSASAFLVINGALLMYIIQQQSAINIQGFNYFASFLIFEFCLMSTIVILIHKARILNS